MTESIIMVCAVAVSVFFIGFPFVHRAVRYRRISKSLPPSEDSDKDGTCGQNYTQVPEGDIYKARFICLQHPSFSAGKTVRIRPLYYNRIKEIIANIGHNEISIISYVDNVLKAHFDDNLQTINSLNNKGTTE